MLEACAEHIAEFARRLSPAAAFYAALERSEMFADCEELDQGAAEMASIEVEFRAPTLEVARQMIAEHEAMAAVMFPPPRPGVDAGRPPLCFGSADAPVGDGVRCGGRRQLVGGELGVDKDERIRRLEAELEQSRADAEAAVQRGLDQGKVIVRQSKTIKKQASTIALYKKLRRLDQDNTTARNASGSARQSQTAVGRRVQATDGASALRAARVGVDRAVKACAVHPCELSDGICQNGGACVEAAAEGGGAVPFECQCAGNFGLDRCETDLCAGVDCGEHGECVRGGCGCSSNGNRVLNGGRCVYVDAVVFYNGVTTNAVPNGDYYLALSTSAGPIDVGELTVGANQRVTIKAEALLAWAAAAMAVQNEGQLEIDKLHISRRIEVQIGGVMSASHCLFQDISNQDDNGGAALFIVGRATIKACTFDRNSAVGGQHHNGGAIRVNGASDLGGSATAQLAVSGSTFTANHADDNGGAIQIVDGRLHIESCQFISNDAPYGGAIQIGRHSRFTMTNTTFRSNTASDAIQRGDAICWDYPANHRFGPNTNLDDGSAMAAQPIVCDIQCQGYALIAFKTSGNGQGLESWVEGSNPCDGTWSGVCCADGSFNYDHGYPPTCGEGGSTVTGLDLAGHTSNGDTVYHGLTGDVTFFASLGSLLILHLYHTTVTGDISILASLRLKHLNIQDTTVNGDIRNLASMPLSYLVTDNAPVSGWPLLAVYCHAFTDAADHTGSTSPECQRDALLAFKASGNGAGLESWVEGGDPCDGSWIGVCCGPDGYDRPGDYDFLGRQSAPACPAAVGAVTGLHLPGYKTAFSSLTGHLTMLAPLSGSLATLTLKYTGVDGQLSDLAGMSGLRYLDLEHCAAVGGDVAALLGCDLRDWLRLGSTGATGWPLRTASGCTFDSATDHVCCAGGSDDHSGEPCYGDCSCYKR
jgi:hypothetical protein